MLLFHNTIGIICVFIHLKELKKINHTYTFKYLILLKLIRSIKIIQLEHSVALLTITIDTNLNM